MCPLMTMQCHCHFQVYRTVVLSSTFNLWIHKQRNKQLLRKALSQWMLVVKGTIIPDSSVNYNNLKYSWYAVSRQEMQAEMLVSKLNLNRAYMRTAWSVLCYCLNWRYIFDIDTCSKIIIIISYVNHNHMYTARYNIFVLQRRYWCLSRAWLKWRQEHIKETTSMAAVQHHNHFLLLKVQNTGIHTYTTIIRHNSCCYGYYYTHAGVYSMAKLDREIIINFF